MPHPDEGLIHAWLDGELDAAEAARVEALVQSDSAWAAAAAEARGLIAATSRIVGALDHVPANVIPKVKPVKRAATQWMWRAAAAIVLVAGSAVVLQREPPNLSVPAAKKEPAKDSVVAPPANAPAPVTARPSAPAIAENRNSLQKKELEQAKQIPAPARDKDALADVAVVPAVPSARAAGAAAGTAAPSPMSQRAMMAENKAAAAPVSCFEQREPPDSAKRIIRLDAASLQDSVRLEKLTLSGDTLAAVHSRLIAVRVRCP